MHSFILSETLKYLYLIMDETNQVHHDVSNTVFTTEGHLLAIPPDKLRWPPSIRRTIAPSSRPTCPAYDPKTSPKHFSPLAVSVQQRTDAEYARALAGLVVDEEYALRHGLWLPEGFCEAPHADDYVSLSLLPGRGVVIEPPPPPPPPDKRESRPWSLFLLARIKRKTHSPAWTRLCRPSMV
jgi:mannosidase alpha-like ER degradation enhancer 1